MSLDKLMGSAPNLEKEKILARLSSVASAFNSSKKAGGSLEPASNFPVPEVITTGIPQLDDEVLVIGGIPVGRGTEIAGHTHSGKSTLALNICREFVAAGKSVVIAENEGSFTYEYGEKIGLQKDTYMIFKGHNMSGEEYLEGVLQLIESGFDLVVIDSITGILSDAAMEAGIVDSKMNTNLSSAKNIAQFFRLLKNGWEGKLPKNKGKIIKGVDTGCTVIVINHLKPIFGSGGFGPPKYESSGSEDIKFYYSMRIWLTRIGVTKDLDEDGNPMYTRVWITCEKNKLSPPGRKSPFCINNKTGRFVSDKKVLLESATNKGLVVPGKGSWVTLVSTGESFNGANAFSDYCNNNPEFLKEIFSFDRH